MGVTEEKKGKAAGCSGETVGRKNMGETAGAMNETEKAYMHWLYQAAGFGSRKFLRSLSSFGAPREIYQMIVSGALAGKVSER